MKNRGFCSGLLITIIIASMLSGCAGQTLSPSPTPPPKAVSGGRPSAISGAPGSGWQEKWQETLAAAIKEGKVTVYAELASEGRIGLTRAFKEKFGLELETVVGSSQELVSKYIQETRGGIYLADVLFSGVGTYLSTIKPNVTLAPIIPRLILPEVKDSGVWPDGGLPFVDKDELAIQTTLGRSLFAIINTDLVREGEIASFRDYLDPKWKGKIIMYDPTIAGNTITWFSILLKEVYGEDEGKKYLSRLAAQEPVITRDKRLPVEWVARGKYPIHIGPNRQMTQEFVKAGAPVKDAREREAIFLSSSSSSFALVAKPAHPNAATILVNWLLTAEAGEVLSKAWGAPAARRDVSTAGLDPINLPIPAEKVVLTTEELFRYNPTAERIARDIFGHLIK